MCPSAQRVDSSALSVWVGSKRYEKLTNLVVAFHGMPQRQFWVELIPVASSVALAREVAVGDKLGDDALGGTFGNAHFCCDIAKPHSGIFGDAQQNVRVISEKGPVGHPLIIDDTRHTKHANGNMYCTAHIEGLTVATTARRYPLSLPLLVQNLATLCERRLPSESRTSVPKLTREHRAVSKDAVRGRGLIEYRLTVGTYLMNGELAGAAGRSSPKVQSMSHEMAIR